MLFRWSAKVAQNKIYRLYQQDALRIEDSELLDDVAFSLYARCQSILVVTRAFQEKILSCPDCGRDISLAADNFTCSCGFSASYEQFRASYKGRQLFGANALPIFEAFVCNLPACHSYSDKMIAVDTLIHSFHILHSARTGYANMDVDDPDNKLGRPVAANLIEGKLSDVVLFLDSLSAETGNDAWRKTAIRANGGSAIS